MFELVFNSILIKPSVSFSPVLCPPHLSSSRFLFSFLFLPYSSSYFQNLYPLFSPLSSSVLFPISPLPLFSTHHSFSSPPFPLFISFPISSLYFPLPSLLSLFLYHIFFLFSSTISSLSFSLPSRLPLSLYHLFSLFSLSLFSSFPLFFFLLFSSFPLFSAFLLPPLSLPLFPFSSLSPFLSFTFHLFPFLSFPLLSFPFLSLSFLSSFLYLSPLFSILSRGKPKQTAVLSVVVGVFGCFLILKNSVHIIHVCCHCQHYQLLIVEQKSNQEFLITTFCTNYVLPITNSLANQ